MQILQMVSKRGLLYCCAIIFNRIVPEWLFRMRYFVVFQICPDSKTTPLSPATCRWANSSEIDQARAFSKVAGDGQDANRQVAIATVGDRLVAVFWSAAERFDEADLGIQFELTENQRWLFGAMVDKSFRGRHVFPDLVDFVKDKLGRDSASELYASVNPFNKPSMSAFKKKSLDIVGRAIVIRFFNFAIGIPSGILEADSMFTSNVHAQPIQIRMASQNDAI